MKYIESPIIDYKKNISIKKGYRQHPIDNNNKLYFQEIVDVREYGILGDNYYFNSNNPPYNQQIPGSIQGLFCRKSIAKKLLFINEILKNYGLELYVFDAYRPLNVQNYLYENRFIDYYKKLNPQMNKSDIIKIRDNYVAFGGHNIDIFSPPPHLTGGAIDLTIKKIDGELLNMGSGFDEFGEVANTDYYENLLINGEKQIEIINNRRLLYNIMIESDFVNNPSERWHYSWGDQMWAKLSNKNAAFFSAIDLVY